MAMSMSLLEVLQLVILVHLRVVAMELLIQEPVQVFFCLIESHEVDLISLVLNFFHLFLHLLDLGVGLS